MLWHGTQFYKTDQLPRVGAGWGASGAGAASSFGGSTCQPSTGRQGSLPANNARACRDTDSAHWISPASGSFVAVMETQFCSRSSNRPSVDQPFSRLFPRKTQHLQHSQGRRGFRRRHAVRGSPVVTLNVATSTSRIPRPDSPPPGPRVTSDREHNTDYVVIGSGIGGE